jgi:hypothetical protein
MAAKGRAACIDYSVGKRWKERKKPGFDGRFQAKLAAARFPDGLLICDDGDMAKLSTW